MPCTLSSWKVKPRFGLRWEVDLLTGTSAVTSSSPANEHIRSVQFITANRYNPGPNCWHIPQVLLILWLNIHFRSTFFSWPPDDKTNFEPGEGRWVKIILGSSIRGYSMMWRSNSPWRTLQNKWWKFAHIYNLSPHKDLFSVKSLTAACLGNFRARFCLPFRAGHIRLPCSQLHNLIHGFESLVVLPAFSTGQQLPHSWSMPRCRRSAVIVDLGGVSCVKWLLGMHAFHFCWWHF